MPRQARLDTTGALHHIMVRGINKTDIFRDENELGLFFRMTHMYEKVQKNIGLQGR
jgi:hypothetical protein